MPSQLQLPKISVGIPVYNGELTISRALDSLLSQTYKNFEIIISDNASNDKTSLICQDYANHDKRIRYIRQERNIGAARNFRFVLDKASSDYFMWSACDDLRSPNFLEENLRFLVDNPSYVASTCPNCMEGEVGDKNKLIEFALDQKLEDRFYAFFDNCWKSHGIFYAVMRTSVIRNCVHGFQDSSLGADWLVILSLASKGPINRTRTGLMVSGKTGISNSLGRWQKFRNRSIHWFLPFYSFSSHALRLSQGFYLRDRLRIVWRLILLNAYAALKQVIWEALRSIPAGNALLNRKMPG
jgi:glycosyltransferase involved in cell wall biosynthesis